jgi:hypothetical protein
MPHTALAARAARVMPPTPHGGTIVIIDASHGDFRHFTPSSFASAHEPRLRLLQGRLRQEALVDCTSAGDGHGGHVREAVRIITAPLARAAGSPQAGLGSSPAGERAAAVPRGRGPPGNPLSV